MKKLILVVLALSVLVAKGPAAQGRATPDSGKWVTAWGTSQQALGNAPITNATLRMIARVTIPGNSVRVRLDNTFGTEPVTIGRASIGYRVQGAAVAAGTSRPLTFNGAPTTTILLPPDLHAHLTRTARARRTSLGQLVREACEIQYGHVSGEDRVRAAEALRRLSLPVG